MAGRDILEVDALIVGGGPAGLAAAYQLCSLNKDLSIAVLEKSKEIDAPIISGAVMEPRGIRRFDAGLEAARRTRREPVEEDHVEQSGIDIFAGFSGADLLIEDDTVVGLRTGDNGIDRNGKPKANFEPGSDIRAKITFDKLTDVYNSGTAQEEDPPSHLQILKPGICHPRCPEEYGNPCQFFCPAGVYEMAESGSGRHLQVHFSNCIHCKTCDIMDPDEIMNGVTPEGGDGPG